MKNEMVTRTIEGFIRQLKKDGHNKYASELKSIVAMSRARKDAILALSGMTITLLEHIIKFLAMPQHRDRNKWQREIRGYLNRFNIRNKTPKKQPWLSLEYILSDLNDVLPSPEFMTNMIDVLSTYPKENQDAALNLLKTHKTLKSLGVKLSFDSENNLCISTNDQAL